MGKTHLSGLQVGDVGIAGSFSDSVQAARVTLTAAAPVDAEFYFTRRSLLTNMYVVTDEGAVSEPVTIELGTVEGDDDFFDALSTDAAATPILKTHKGRLWVRQTDGTFPSTVIIEHIPIE